MKKTIIAIVVLITLVGFSACKYDDAYGDFDYTTCYFSHDQKDRSVIIDEFDFIQVGCVFGGKLSNDDGEWFQYELVDSLVTNAGYEVLPDSLYTISANSYKGPATNTVEIPVGRMLGMMTVTLKPEFFLSTEAFDGNYALGFRVVDASTDSIGNRETVVTFKYLSNAIGVYMHSGRAVSTDSVMTYKNEDVTLTTTMPVGSNSVISGKVALGNNNLVFNLIIDEDNKVTVTEGAGSAFPITTVSAGFFDREGDNSIYLNYSFDDNGTVFEATDTLTFKDRTVDDVPQNDPQYF